MSSVNLASSLLSACLLISTVVLTGCGSGNSRQSAPGETGVVLTYESQPLSNVLVRLHASAEGPMVAKAVSGIDGQVDFVDLPSPEPDEYFVSLQSLGDGGWILDPQFASATESGLRLQAIDTNNRQTIDLPSGVVRSLDPTSDW